MTITPGHKPAVDRTSAVGPGWDSNYPAGREATTPQAARSKRAFSVKNGSALAVFQRAAHDWGGQVVQVSSTDPTQQLVGRMRGRESTTIWVPTKVVVSGVVVTALAGVLYAPTQGELQNGGGLYLGIGDSVTVESEGPVYVGYIPGGETGYCQYMQFYNPYMGEAPGT